MSLGKEALLLLSILRDQRLWLSLVLFVLLLIMSGQSPLSYQINIGQDDGLGSDVPLVAGMYAPEQHTNGEFRWTMGRAIVQAPGVGYRPLVLTLNLLPLHQEITSHRPPLIEVWAAGQSVGQLLLRPSGGKYMLLLPPPAAGDQLIELHSATVVPAGDKRAIAVPLDAVSLRGRAGPVIPALRTILLWVAAAVLLWLTLRRVGFSSDTTRILLFPALLLVVIASILDPLRWALGAVPALTALALALVLVLLLCAEPRAVLTTGGILLVLALGIWTMNLQPRSIAMLATSTTACMLAGWVRPGLSRFSQIWGLPIPAHRSWLLAMAVLVFVLRFGGKIYPGAMPGDINFHANRYEVDFIQGTVLIVANNRGVNFPYPPAFYVILAPLTLLGLDVRTQLRAVAALLDAASLPLIYLLALRVTTMRRWALVAAGLYAFTAAGFMTTWWNFSSHIFTQFAHLVLITMLVVGLPYLNSAPGPSKRTAICLLTLAQVVVYLGHFGFWINMTLLGFMTVLMYVSKRGWNGKQSLIALLISMAAAELFVGLFFYSAYSAMFAAQAQQTAVGGLTNLAGHEAADPNLLWWSLWEEGFQAHFGFFPVPLALCGLLMLYWHNRQRRHSMLQPTDLLLIVAVGTLTIDLVFAGLPFISGAALATRWLMFSAWLIAVGAAYYAQHCWRSGPAGRLVIAVIGVYVLWHTASLWLMALAWRIRPPEPF